MKIADSIIPTYNIREVHADAGLESKGNDLFVYTNDQLSIQEKMLLPARSAHFSIHLNLGEALEIKYNLVNYSISKNALFIIHPGIIHALVEVENLPTITIGFTQDFFASSMLHKKHAEALGFLSQQSVPLFLLTEN